MQVPKSKNDQVRRGDEVIISELPSRACPVKLLKKYLTKFQILPDSRDLIFRPISKGKDSCKLIASDKSISYGTIWIKDFLFPSSLGSKPCKLLVSIYLVFAQFFVTL